MYKPCPSELLVDDEAHATNARTNDLIGNLVQDFLPARAHHFVICWKADGVWWSSWPVTVEGESKRNQISSGFDELVHLLSPVRPQGGGNRTEEAVVYMRQFQCFS